MEIGEEILKAIQILINKAIENLVHQDIEAIIESVTDNICTVNINGSKYKAINGTNIVFKPYEKCLIHCINGNFNHKIIIAKL